MTKILFNECRQSYADVSLRFLLYCLLGKQKLSFRTQMIFVPAFHFVHVHHWHPLLYLVALQGINADTGFFSLY